MLEALVSLLISLQGTPVPTLLVMGGLVFLFLAVAGQFSEHTSVSKKRQIWAGIVGALLLLSGVALYAAPASSTAPTPTIVVVALSTPTPAPPVPPDTLIPPTSTSVPKLTDTPKPTDTPEIPTFTPTPMPANIPISLSADTSIPTDTPTPTFTSIPPPPVGVPTDTPTPTFTPIPPVHLPNKECYRDNEAPCGPPYDPPAWVPAPGSSEKACTDTVKIPLQPAAVLYISMTTRPKINFNWGYSLWEVRAYGPKTGDKNLALLGAVTRSSVENSARLEGYAVDGDLGTRWSSAQKIDPQSLEIVLREPADVDRVELVWESAVALDYCVYILPSR